MPKRKARLTVRLPPYPEPRTTKGGLRPGMAWRRAVYRAIMTAARERGIEKYAGVDLDCEVIVYLSRTKMRFHDVDNLQKHIFDALQGRLGGSKAGTRRRALLPNDYQIRRVVVEKREHESANQHSRLILRDFVKIQRYRKGHR